MKVSYLVPAYNHVAFITKTIDSILAQTHQNIEIIVCDDCSTDGTDMIAKKYAEQYGIIFLQNEKRSGIVYSLRRMMEIASGEYIGMCASDDWINPEKVEKQIRFLTKNKMDAVYGPIIKYHEGTDKYEEVYSPGIKKIIDDGELLEHIYKTGEGAGLIQSALFRADKAKKISFHSKYKSDDFLFQIRFLQAGYTIGYLDEPLTYYRIHSSNTHKDRLYCLNELILPVYRDFIPKQYQRNLIRQAYCETAVDLAKQMEFGKSFRLQCKTMRDFPSVITAAHFIKADIRYITKKTGLYRLYWRIAHPGIEYRP